MGIRKAIALLLALAGLSIAAAACSASVSTGDSSTPGGSKTYTNDEFGFSLTYDTMLVERESTGGTSGGAGSVFDIAFADPDGAKIGDKLVDGIQISVYKLARKVKPAEVPKLKSEVQSVVEQLMSSMPSAKVVEPLEDVTVNGVPGFGFKYAYTEDGAEVTAVTFFLIKGTYEYQITAQATSENWETLKGKLEAALQTFTVK